MSQTEQQLSNNEKQLLAREIAADKRQKHMQREYSTDCPECDTTVWVFSASQGERAVFLEGWNAAMEYMEEQRTNNRTADMEIDLGD